MRERGTPLRADPVAPLVWQMICRFSNNAGVAKKANNDEVIEIVVEAIAVRVAVN